MKLDAPEIRTELLPTSQASATSAMPPLSAVETALKSRIAAGRKCLVPYFTAGFPNVRLFQMMLRNAQSLGCDAVEVGIPFSDPIADGPAIQYSSQQALAKGVSLPLVLEMLEQTPLEIPVILMGYLNPILAYGLRRFAEDARAIGVSGVIIPDFPLENAAAVQPGRITFAPLSALEVVLMAAPTTSPHRLKAIGTQSRGFLYAVTVTGTTGARKKLPIHTREFLQRARNATTRPVLAGFGISSAAVARSIAADCDGVIVGSALVEAIRAASKFGAAKRVARLLGQIRQVL